MPDKWCIVYSVHCIGIAPVSVELEAGTPSDIIPGIFISEVENLDTQVRTKFHERGLHDSESSTVLT